MSRRSAKRLWIRGAAEARNTHVRKALAAAHPSLARAAFDSILALSDPADLPNILEPVANRDSYPEAANLLHRVVNPYKPSRLVELILGRGYAPHVRCFRVATDCGYFTIAERDNLRGKNYPPLFPEDLAAAVDKPKRRKGARLSLAVLGYVEISSGWIPVIDTSPDAPGLWPLDRKERAGLALHLLVRRFVYHEAYDSFLVRS